MNNVRTSSAERKLARRNAELCYEGFCHDISGLEPGILSAEVNAVPSLKGPDKGKLRPIEVPLGDIAYHSHPDRLPVIGVLFPKQYEQTCLSGLAALLAEHRAQPFFRPIFLVFGFELLPLFGRYGFAYKVLPSDHQEGDFDDLHGRYGMSSVRRLLDARPIWFWCGD